jgi:ribosome-binding factor A
MKRSFSRSDRLSSEIKKIFNAHLRGTVQNPILKESSITEVLVSKDLAILTVYFTLDRVTQAIEAEKEFNRSKGYFKELIAKNLRMRRIPDIKFLYDKQREQADRITDLLNNL